MLLRRADFKSKKIKRLSAYTQEDVQCRITTFAHLSLTIIAKIGADFNLLPVTALHFLRVT